MDCKTAENELSRREADLLEPAQQAELAAHLAGCPSCRDAESRIREAARALSSLPIKRAPPNFLEDSWRRIQKEAPPPDGSLTRLKRWVSARQAPPLWVPLSAAALVIAVVLLLPALKDGAPDAPRPPAYRVLAQAGATRVRALPGGKALLETDAGGKLEVEHLGRARYALAGAGNRLAIGLGQPDAIELAAGTAEVSVQPDPAHPYAVVASGARVTVTGTRFRLVAGDAPKVEVLEGRVSVTGPDWNRELTAGQALSWTDSGPTGP